MDNQKGFTLVEILVAIALMVVGILAVVGTQVVALNANSIANQLSVATSLASGAIEDISSDAWKRTEGVGLSNGTDNLPFGTPTTYDTYSYQNGGVYTITCNPTENNPTDGIVRLDVHVEYNYKGNTKTVTMSSYKRVI